MKEIAIVGATGFIGKHLLDFMAHQKNVQVRALVRKNHNDRILSRNNITVVEGNLMKPETIEELIVPGCTVVNLAYPYSCIKN